VSQVRFVCRNSFPLAVRWKEIIGRGRSGNASFVAARRSGKLGFPLVTTSTSQAKRLSSSSGGGIKTVSMQHALILEMCHMLFTPFIFVHRRLPRPSLSLPSLSPWLARSLARSLALAVYLSVSLFSFALVAVRYIFLSLLRFPRSFVPRSSFLSLPLLTYSLPFTPPPPPLAPAFTLLFHFRYSFSPACSPLFLHAVTP